MAGNIVELQANHQEIDAQRPFSQNFPAVVVDELMLEMDPKHCGPPVCAMSGEDGAKKEIHPLPLRGREGRYSSHIGGDTKWTGISITIARGMKAKLIKVRLVVKSHAPGVPPSPATPPA